MNAFLILVLLLTIAYIIYYGIVASQDIIAAKKSGESTVETIEVSSMSDDQVKTVEVHETAEGFRIGNEETKISTPAISAAALPGVTSATTPGTTVATTVGTTLETTVATTGKTSNDIVEVKQKMSSAVQVFDIEQSMTNYSEKLEVIGADCIMGTYQPEIGTPMICRYITPEASNPIATVDENENIIEDNSPKADYDKI